MRFLLASLPLVVAGMTPDAGQVARFTSKVESVRVDVLATAGSRPVAGLSAADFEVKDNGVRQAVALVSSDTAPVNVMIALDTSASLSRERLARLREASRALIHKLAPGEAAGLITFNHVIEVPQPMTHDRARIGKALDRVSASGGTSLVDAASLGLSLTEQGAGRGLLLVFSDGVDTTSWQTEDVVLRSAARSETVLYAVSVTPEGASPRFLRDIAAATGGKVLEVQSSDRLEAAFVQILAEFRQRYLLSYTPTGVEKPGWHKIEVRVKRRGVTARARPGYYAR